MGPIVAVSAPLPHKVFLNSNKQPGSYMRNIRSLQRVGPAMNEIRTEETV